MTARYYRDENGDLFDFVTGYTIEVKSERIIEDHYYINLELSSKGKSYVIHRDEIQERR